MLSIKRIGFMGTVAALVVLCAVASAPLVNATTTSDDAAAILVVGVAETKPHTVRVNVSLPEDTLRKIDRIAKKRGMSRSSFLVHAAEKVITAGSAVDYAPVKQGRNRENRRRASAEKR